MKRKSLHTGDGWTEGVSRIPVREQPPIIYVTKKKGGERTGRAGRRRSKPAFKIRVFATDDDARALIRGN